MKRAGELGIPVVGHVVRSVDLEGTLGSRQRGIVHMEEYLYTYFGYRISDTTGTHPARLDTTAIPYLARATAAAGVWVTPTLVTFEGILEQAEDLERALARPEVAYVPAALFDATWAPGRNRYTRFATPVHRANLRAALAYQRRMLRAFHEAGVGLLVGTDAPVPAVVPGFAVHDELANFVEAGLPPYAALRAATRSAAEYLGRDDFGTVEPGKRADLLLLDADPRAGVAAAARPAGVMVRGEWLDRARLDALLPERRAESPPR